jgi:hypothetical protein
MNVSRQEAAEALDTVKQAKDRGKAFRFYAGAGPYFILWGAIWIVTDIALEIWPGADWIWPVAATGGGILSGVLPWFLPRLYLVEQRPRTIPWRGILTYVVFFAFCGAMFTLMSPPTPQQVHAFWGVFFGSIYMIAGIWVGVRGFLIGFALFALSIAGFLFVKEHFYLYMGLTGGVAMVIGGIWIDRT